MAGSRLRTLLEGEWSLPVDEGRGSGSVAVEPWLFLELPFELFFMEVSLGWASCRARRRAR